MIGSYNEYNMAVALLNFAHSYQAMCKASRKLPDLDVSEGYPWFLLDYEEIEPAVVGWARMHASKLLDMCPDIVENPSCLGCRYLSMGLAASGLCVGQEAVKCANYPKILFERDLVKPALVAAGVYDPKWTDQEVYLNYQQEVLKRVNQNKGAV